MSSQDSGCTIFCCFRGPRTYSPAKKALDEEAPLNLKDVASTHGANYTEIEANNFPFPENQECQERNVDGVQDATFGHASTEAQQKGGRTSEAITDAPLSQKESPLSQNEPPLSQNEPPLLLTESQLSQNKPPLPSSSPNEPPLSQNEPPECVYSSPLRAETGGKGISGVGNGEFDVGNDVTVKVCVAQLDVDEEQLAQHVSCLEKLVERLEAVADALEAAPGSKGVNDAILSGLSIGQTELFNPAEGSLPSCVLDGSEWTVKNHHDNQELLVHTTDDHQNVSIRNCSGCTIQIDGKPDSISIDDCVKCGVVFHDAATSVNVSNCQRLQIQVLGIVPSICAKNTDGLSIYVNHECSDVPVFSFKCSELNMLVPSDSSEGDFMEVSIPEQFRSHWNGDCWSTDIADIIA